VEGDGTKQCVTCVQEDLKNELAAIETNITANLKKIEDFLKKGDCDPHRMERYAFFAQSKEGMMYKKPSIGHCQEKNRVTFNDTDHTLNSNGINNENVFKLSTGKFTVPVNGIYFFEFHAVKAPRWNPTKRTDMSTCIVKLVKEHDPNTEKATITPIAEGKVIAEDWYSSFPIQIEAIVHLEKTETISVQLYDGELLGDWMTSFTGFLLEKDDNKDCILL